MKRRIRKELLDELLADYRGPADMTGPDGLLKQLTGALVERALAAELTDHLGHEPGEPTVSGNAPADASIGVGSCRGSHAQERRTSALRSTRAPPAPNPPTVKRTRPCVSSREGEISCCGFSTR